jgi:hypothetical protein
VNQSFNYNGLVYIGENLVYLSGVKSFIKSENRYNTLYIAPFNKQDQAFINYKERWQIETMFKAIKTCSFNIEDTHLTDLPLKLCLTTILRLWHILHTFKIHTK